MSKYGCSPDACGVCVCAWYVRGFGRRQGAPDAAHGTRHKQLSPGTRTEKLVRAHTDLVVHNSPVVNSRSRRWFANGRRGFSCALPCCAIAQGHRGHHAKRGWARRTTRTAGPMCSWVGAVDTSRRLRSMSKWVQQRGPAEMARGGAAERLERSGKLANRCPREWTRER